MFIKHFYYIQNNYQYPSQYTYSQVLGDKEIREVQKEALEKIVYNKVGDTPFLICASDLAVNFGKTLVFCGLHQAFKRKLKTVLLLNSADLFKQFKKEIPELLPGEKVAFIQGS